MHITVKKILSGHQSIALYKIIPNMCFFKENQQNVLYFLENSEYLMKSHSDSNSISVIEIRGSNLV